jgi:predicted dinucleotide-binding enzyme
MTTLRIAVLGAGKIGGAIGRKWTAAGHQVAYGVRDPQAADAQALLQSGDQVTVGQVGEALASDPQVVLMAAPGAAMETTIVAYAEQLNGRVIIDAANRIGSDRTDSWGFFQAHTPQAKVYRAFNIYGFENFANPLYGGVQADLFFAGPEGESLTHVEQLIREVGLRPVRLGDTDQIPTVDALLPLWFTLARAHGRHLALKLLTDEA